MYTKEQIKDKLANDLVWMERALVVLFERQTLDEQQTDETKHLNGVGFNSSDSRYLSYCAKWVKKGNHLSKHHVEKVGKKLPKYWEQIQSIIRQKEG